MTTLAPIGGLPVVAVPAGLVDSLPVGLSLAGPVGSDEQLIQLAALIAPR
jgi:Asp-tRNA(Asn)/Glu-tRNA(Gln) amidotransferase A subunit family amidase